MNDFYGDQILSKKIELDQKMKQTTVQLETKLTKAVEIADEVDNEFEDDDVTFECLSKDDAGKEKSSERLDTSLNNSMRLIENVQINFRNQRTSQPRKNSDDHHQLESKNKLYEEKLKRKTDKAQNFKKLMLQLKELQEEIINQSDHQQASSISPKRSNNDLLNTNEQPSSQVRMNPFRQDPKQYMDKVLSLISIINEVDELTNVAELKDKIQSQKMSLAKLRSERDEFAALYIKIKQEYEKKCREKEEEQRELRETNGQLQLNVNQMTDQMQELTRQTYELTQKMSQLGQENQDLLMRNSQAQDSVNMYLNQIQSL